MGEIIAFRSNARTASREPPAQGGAQILFFLGVRYVRDETTATRAPRGRGGGKRKKRA